MAKKTSGMDMGDYLYSKSEFDAYKWCIDNGIYVCPVSKSNSEWYLCIEMNGKRRCSPDAYKKVEVWKQLYKYYKYYYEKYKK